MPATYPFFGIDIATQAELDAEAAARAAADALAIPLTQKAAANGVATLDSGGKVPTGQVPAIGVGGLSFDPATQAELDALAAQKGAANGIATLDGTSKLTVSQLPTSVVSGSALWVSVKDATYNAKGDGATDDTAAIQAAITAVAGNGTVFFPAGTYYLNSATATALLLPRTATGLKIIGAGQGQTTIKLSANTPRAFDFNKVADHDVFQNITLEDFTVDANSITGKHHVVLGNYQNGSLQTRFGVNNLRIRRVRTINVPSATTTGTYDTAVLHRLNIHIAVVHAAANEVTQDQILDVAIEDCNFGVSGGGGNEGVFIGGTVSAAPTGQNVWMDDVHIRRCKWTSGALPTQFFASAGFQLGSCAFGGRATIEKCDVAYSGDVGYEIDSLMKVDLVDCTGRDCWNHVFYMKNVNYVGNYATSPYTSGTAQTRGQRWNYTRCRAYRAELTNGAHGFRVDTANSVPMGDITLRDCVWHRTSSDFSNITGEAFGSVGTYGNLIIEGMTVDIEGMSATGAASALTVISVDGAGPLVARFLRNTVRLQGANTSGNTQTIRVVEVFANTVSPLTTHTEVDGLYIDPSFSSGNFAIIGVQLGQSSANTSNITGTVRRVKFNAGVGFTSSWTGVTVGNSTRTVIVSRTGIRIEECDFSAINSNPISIGTGNLANVWIDRCGPPRTATAADYTALQTDEVIAVTSTAAARTITLPPISSASVGKMLAVVDESNAAGTNNITIQRAGSDTFLGGGTTVVINANGGDKRVFSNGTVWVPVAA